MCAQSSMVIRVRQQAPPNLLSKVSLVVLLGGFI